jgi:serine/threonine protein kinase
MIGRTLGHYVIESKLGQGGMGVVYSARDTRLGRAVAVKVLASEVTGDAERRRRFVREARAAAAVTHPAVAQVYDVDEQDGVIFIAMELVEGRTVRQLIGAHEIDVPGALDIAIQVGSGLAKAHDAGIVHRDIKADNVMVTPDGHAKLLDFGLAKLVDSGSSPDSASETTTRAASSAATQAGMVLGTIAYMSPEQARGRGVDQRSDIFSLGVLLYEMSTGQMPFAGASPIDTMHAIAFDEARPVTELRPGLPPDLQRVVARCMRKRPEDRYQTTRAFVDDLKRLRADTESGTVRALPLRERLQRRLEDLQGLKDFGTPWIAAGVGLLAVVVLLIAFDKVRLSSLVLLGLSGMVVYRWVKNRRRRLIAKAVARLKKRKEVRLVIVAQDHLTIVVDEADADLYSRIHGLVEGVTRKLYFGRPLTGSVRDDVQPGELAQMLQRPGVLYLRPDVAKLARTSSAPPLSKP